MKNLIILSIVVALASCKASFYSSTFTVEKVEKSVEPGKEKITLKNTGEKKIHFWEHGKYSLLQADSGTYHKGNIVDLKIRESDSSTSTNAELFPQAFVEKNRITTVAATDAKKQYGLGSSFLLSEDIPQSSTKIIEKQKTFANKLFVPQLKEIPSLLSFSSAGLLQSLADAIMVHDPWPESNYWAKDSWKRLYKDNLQINGKRDFFSYNVWPWTRSGWHLATLGNRLSIGTGSYFSVKINWQDIKEGKITLLTIVGQAVRNLAVYQATYVAGYNWIFR